LILIWGAAYPIYKVALSYTPPLIFAGMRASIGGAILGVILLVLNKKISWKNNWLKYCISAFLNTLCFFGLQTVGLEYLSSGLFAILIYFQPVLVCVFAWIWLGENINFIKMIGLILGFSGISIVSIKSFFDQLSIIGIVLGLLTAILWAAGVCYVKKVSHEVDAFWMVALQNIIGGGALLIIGNFFEKWSDISWEIGYTSGLIYGSILGIPIAFLIYYDLINKGDASKVSSFTFLIPIVSVFIGYIFLKESITYTVSIGLFFVVISICLVNIDFKKLANK